MKKEKIKLSFKRYIKASNEKKQCKEPCIKNGKADRYCYACASEILEPIIPIL